MGYGSWEEKCPGTKDSPHICTRGPEFTKHFHLSYLCLHALTGARLSSSLSLPVSAPGFVYLEHHTVAGSSPGAAMHTCRGMPTHPSTLVCLSPRPGLILVASPPHPLRLPSVVGPLRAGAFADYSWPWLAVTLPCSPVLCASQSMRWSSSCRTSDYRPCFSLD